MKRAVGIVCCTLILLVGGILVYSQSRTHSRAKGGESTAHAHADSLKNKELARDKYDRLTDADFELVAKQLGVETAAIKAVVSIEAGSAMKGFAAPGVPIVNFDASMYRQYASKAENRAGAKGETVPEGLTGHQKSEWTQLINARKSNAQGANMGTFWGMFQIGGFNYKRCGCKSVDEFVKKMSTSELEQLELFAAFIENNGMVKELRAKNWAAFARRYNGPGYAKRGYHTKMANAYSKFKAQETKSKNTTSPDAKVTGKELKLK